MSFEFGRLFDGDIIRLRAIEDFDNLRGGVAEIFALFSRQRGNLTSGTGEVYISHPELYGASERSAHDELPAARNQAGSGMWVVANPNHWSAPSARASEPSPAAQAKLNDPEMKVQIMVVAAR
jgi:O-glycosyl hydrolase